MGRELDGVVASRDTLQQQNTSLQWRLRELSLQPREQVKVLASSEFGKSVSRQADVDSKDHRCDLESPLTLCPFLPKNGWAYTKEKKVTVVPAKARLT